MLESEFLEDPFLGLDGLFRQNGDVDLLEAGQSLAPKGN